MANANDNDETQLNAGTPFYRYLTNQSLGKYQLIERLGRGRSIQMATITNALYPVCKW